MLSKYVFSDIDSYSQITLIDVVDCCAAVLMFCSIRIGVIRSKKSHTFWCQMLLESMSTKPNTLSVLERCSRQSWSHYKPLKELSHPSLILNSCTALLTSRSVCRAHKAVHHTFAHERSSIEASMLTLNRSFINFSGVNEAKRFFKICVSKWKCT